MKATGLSVIVQNEEQFKKIQEFLGKEVLYIDWAPQMGTNETAVVIWAMKKTSLSVGSTGLAEYQRDLNIRVVEFEEFLSEDKVTPKAKELLEDIVWYRKEKKGKCVSTTHYLTAREYRVIAPELMSKFKEVEIRKLNYDIKAYPGKRIVITIPM